MPSAMPASLFHESFFVAGQRIGEDQRPERRRRVEHRGDAGAKLGLAGENQREGNDVVGQRQQEE